MVGSHWRSSTVSFQTALKQLNCFRAVCRSTAAQQRCWAAQMRVVMSTSFQTAPHELFIRHDRRDRRELMDSPNSALESLDSAVEWLKSAVGESMSFVFERLTSFTVKCEYIDCTMCVHSFSLERMASCLKAHELCWWRMNMFILFLKAREL